MVEVAEWHEAEYKPSPGILGSLLDIPAQALAVALISAAAGLYIAAAGLRAGTIAGALIACFPWGYAYVMLQVAPRKWVSRSFRKWLESRAPLTGSVVHIELDRGESPIGQDDGVVTFREGLLCFEGMRTSFLLSRADVEIRGRASFNQRPFGQLHDLVVNWTAPVLGLATERSVTILMTNLSDAVQRPLWEGLIPWLNGHPTISPDSILPPLHPPSS